MYLTTHRWYRSSVLKNRQASTLKTVRLTNDTCPSPPPTHTITISVTAGWPGQGPDLKRSWPAVSHICNFSRVPSSSVTNREKKSTPTVGSYTWRQGGAGRYSTLAVTGETARAARRGQHGTHRVRCQSRAGKTGHTTPHEVTAPNMKSLRYKFHVVPQ